MSDRVSSQVASVQVGRILSLQLDIGYPCSALCKRELCWYVLYFQESGQALLCNRNVVTLEGYQAVYCLQGQQGQIYSKA